ncbi:UNVERIFIED_CONTAM: hypothetical protein Slati_2158900 [Sesamum latifolium]|uniref:Uncharacterized protein n=1 Tax=Sesamum latifolium TaxID=2727402 RepID=A0AAW2WUZ0_9LAMI
MKQDACYLVNKCEKCQKHVTLIHQPAEPLNVMLSPCHFSPIGHGHSRTISTSIWAKKISPSCHRLLQKMGRGRTSCPYRSRESHEVHMEEYHMSFWTAPRTNIRQWPTILGTKDTRLVCWTAHKAKIHLSISSQANGQVEVTNRILVQGIKKRVDKVGGNWVEELASVLWSYRTTPRGSTGKIPFTLVYET